MSPRFAGITVAAVIAIGPLAAAAQAPAANWSSFTKVASVAACTAFAEAVLRKEHLRVLNRSGSVLLAGNNTVMVEIACYPSGASSGVLVSAFSTDRKTAERTRSTLDTTMERVLCSDLECQ